MARVKGLTAAVVLSFVFSFSSPVALAAPYVPPQEYSDPAKFVGLNFVESFSSTGEAASFITNVIEPVNKSQNPEGFEQYLCLEGYGEKPCNFGAKSTDHVHAQVLAPVCKTQNQIDCIESVSIYDADGPSTPAELIKEIDGTLVKANPSQNLPLGGTKSVWRSEKIHAGGSGQYNAYVALALNFNNRTKKFEISGLTSQIIPTTEMTGNYKPTTYSEFVSKEGLNRVSSSSGPRECAWLDTGTCGVIQDFAPNTRATLTIRIQSSIGGWFKGRMTSPNIKVEKFNSKANRITVDASPVEVPMVTGIAPKDSSDAGIMKLLKSTSFVGRIGGVHNVRSDNSFAIEELEYFRSFLKDTSSGVNTIWSVGTAPYGQGGFGCLSDPNRVLGIVTTNATTYEGSAPNFSKGFLQYNLGGMHYLPGGTELALGTYDLVMRSDVARCLYGFSKAPLSGSVSVVNEKGAKTTATTVVSEKNGWLKMAAYGFTFSKKTIKVKITKKK